ncbi:MAG: glucose-6-phosphate dehydrogenase assembly protein OpcA [Deltaproteobacteria bacterium]
MEHLYGLTLSLLIADLPVEVWWSGEIPLQSPLFKNIVEESDRVWMDSAKFSQPHKALALLALTWKEHFPNIVLADLNWIRFLRWRNLIAELFDGKWASYLDLIREVTIEYGERRQPTRSFLLVCWLASRLGWHYEGRPLQNFPERLEFAGHGGKVAVTINPVPVMDQERDRLYGVRILTANGHQGKFSVVRDKDPQCVLARSEIDGKLAFSRMLYFEHLESVRLLVEGLQHLGRDSSWEDTLAMLASIIKA